jgi:hypothetical protein
MSIEAISALAMAVPVSLISFRRSDERDPSSVDAVAIVGCALESIRGDTMPKQTDGVVPEPHPKLFEALIGTS